MDNGAVGSWDDIIKAMDSEFDQQIADLEAFKFIAECYRLGCGKILPDCSSVDGKISKPKIFTQCIKSTTFL